MACAIVRPAQEPATMELDCEVPSAVSNDNPTTDTLLVLCHFNAAAPTTLLGTLVQELASCGDISQFQALSDEEVIVSFFDTRAAARAAELLGTRAKIVPEPHAVHTVWLPGTFSVEQEQVSALDAVKTDGGAAEVYAVTFFDAREAEKAAAGVVANGALLGVNVEGPASAAVEPDTIGHAAPTMQPATIDTTTTVTEPTFVAASVPSMVMGQDSVAKLDASPEWLVPNFLRPLRQSGHGPLYMKDLRSSEVRWADVANGADTRTTLRLRFLPARLCAPATFQEALQKAGIADCVDCFRIVPRRGGLRNLSQPGSALVNAVSQEAVLAIAKYFHGRQWGGRSTPVAVSFAEVQGKAQLERAMPLTAECGLVLPRTLAASRTAPGLRRHAIYEAASESLASTADSGDLDTSTQASTCEGTNFHTSGDEAEVS